MGGEKEQQLFFLFSFPHDSVYRHFLLIRTSLNKSLILSNGEITLTLKDMKKVISLKVIRNLPEIVYMHVVSTLLKLPILNKQKHYEIQISIQNPEKHKELIRDLN